MLSLIFGALLSVTPVDSAPVCDPASIRRTAGDKTDAAASLRIEKAAKHRIEVAYVDTVSGSCAPLIDGLIASQVSLRTGTVLDFDAKGVASVRRDKYSLFSIRTPPGVVPTIPRATFLGAALFEQRNSPVGLKERYLGLWRQGGGALVATFEVVGGRASKPKPVLRSRVPVRGIGFFPSPDAPTGGIGLVQDTSPTVRLLTLEWNHRDWFGRD